MLWLFPSRKGVTTAKATKHDLVRAIRRLMPLTGVEPQTGNAAMLPALDGAQMAQVPLVAFLHRWREYHLSAAVDAGSRDVDTLLRFVMLTDIKWHFHAAVSTALPVSITASVQCFRVNAMR